MSKILAIETSCDDTSIAIVDEDYNVLSMKTNSQVNIFKSLGGVVPEIAARSHSNNFESVLGDVLNDAGLTFEDVDAIAVTNEPGLMSSVFVGLCEAKMISLLTAKPLLRVNHLVGHICSILLSEKTIVYPSLCLLVSGGHTNLYYLKSKDDFQLLGETKDDAIGEAYDKVAKMMGLEYPGGPNIEKLASEIKETLDLKVSNLEDYNFSYSGLKSNVANLIDRGIVEKSVIANSFQESAINQLMKKIIMADNNMDVKRCYVVGGVSQNMQLQKKLSLLDIPMSFPKQEYCGDNGAMIGAAAIYLKGKNVSIK